ncbi:Retinoid isomerohydrolase [Seminavis robusta]|uniref:Retinoid isomerohydrolase n=1 Tax=Seminavis robusta TaxID=568900 RepID=A0A9N8HNY1_9STRA|nr:Retinoid isomerohydrolase [Seminavis robusta]|eukprot:Sro1034_g233870.1 Retinoid isomerohydrolase (563) ;mRNA; r:25958-27646
MSKSMLLFPISLLPFLLLLLLSRRGVSSFSAPTTKTTNVGFQRWITDAPDEVKEPKVLHVEGTIPSYVKGSLIRNGGGIWSLDETTQSAHIFDGLAKLSLYQINDGNNDNSVSFTSRFVDSYLYREWAGKGSGVPSVHIGPLVDKETKTAKPQTKWLQALLNIPAFDNAPVNVWDFSAGAQDNSNVWCLTDTTIRATLDKNSLDTLQSGRQPPAAHNAPGFYELSATAHPEYCKRGTGATYNVGTHIGFPNYHLCLIKDDPRNSQDRQVIAKYKLPYNEIPYMHSFGLTQSKAIVVLQPLRQNSNFKVLLTEGFMPSMQHVDETTKVLVFDLESGDLLADTSLPEQVYFYHAISSAEDDTENNVSIKLCAYRTPDMITGEDMFFRFDRAWTAEGRNRIPRPGTLCDVTVHLQQDTASVQWTPAVDTKSGTEQGFELPTTRYSRTTNGQGPWQQGRHPRYTYAFGAYAQGSSEYDCWAILKIDTETGQAVSFRERDSCYYSEPIFVANPDGVDEDDGVLLCTRMDGRTEETSLLVVDAKTMTKMAEANTKTRVAMDFHGAFFG